jgi:hypothetical protein
MASSTLKIGNVGLLPNYTALQGRRPYSSKLNIISPNYILKYKVIQI